MRRLRRTYTPRAHQRPSAAEKEALELSRQSLRETRKATKATVLAAWLSMASLILSVATAVLAFYFLPMDYNVRRSTLITNSWNTLANGPRGSSNRGQGEAISTLVSLGISLRDIEATNDNLSHLVLTPPSGTRANLSHSNLCKSNFQGSDLRGAVFKGSIFGEMADLTGITGEGASFFWAFLQRSMLTGSNFEGGDFSGADLRGAFADGVNFRRANFNYADLRSISFSSIHFPREPGTDGRSKPTDVTGATFYGADLRNTDLSTLTGLTRESLNGACVDQSTRLPEGISVTRPCVLEVPRGSLTTRHAIPILGDAAAQQYRDRAKRCGPDFGDDPPAIRRGREPFAIELADR